MTIENETPQDRWAASPRPLQFVRVRLYRGGQAELVRDILADEVDVLFEELGTLRGSGKNESDQEIIDCAQNIRHLPAALRDISNALVELTGPDGF